MKTILTSLSSRRAKREVGEEMHAA
jgi:hypothetical protein